MKTIPIRSIQPQHPKGRALAGFRIRTIEEVVTGKEMNQDLHRHDFYFILVVWNGKGVHTIDFEEYPVKANSVFIMRPGQVHKLKLSAGSKGYLMEVSKRFEFLTDYTRNELLRKAANRNQCQLDKSGSVALAGILKTIEGEFRTMADGFEHVISASIEIFLILYLRYRQKGQSVNIKAHTYQQEKMQEFSDLLEANIGKIKQASVYAEMLNLSPFQLNSITKSLLGKTASDLIEEQILLEAKRHLLATANQVNQIAFELGYEDVSYFIRWFKKLTGHTPELFRKNFR